jgi:hypothetical protein
MDEATVRYRVYHLQCKWTGQLNTALISVSIISSYKYKSQRRLNRLLFLVTSLVEVTSQKAKGVLPDEVIEFLNLTNPSRRTAASGVGLAANRNGVHGGGMVRKADNLTAICEPIV